MTIQRESLVTLGVSDLVRSRAFYEAWGWRVRQESPQIVFFQMDGRALTQPTATEWGGYSGYFCDPDGHVWELAVNPFWDTSESGTVIPDDLPRL